MLSENIKIKMSFQKESWPLKESFKTSNRSLDLVVAETIVVQISKNNFIGRGESTPFLRYGESVENSLFQLEKIKPLVEKNLSRDELQDAIPPNSARCAVDCAMWDLEAKIKNKRVWELAQIKNKAEPIPNNKKRLFFLFSLSRILNNLLLVWYWLKVRIKVN